MQLGLKVMHGVPEESQYALLPVGKRLILGRHGPEQGIDLQLTCSSISRIHCSLSHDDTGIWIEDLQSRNGTALNGTWLNSRAHPTFSPGAPTRYKVHPCDLIRIGPAEVRLVFLGPVSRAWRTLNDRAIPKIAEGIRRSRWFDFPPDAHTDDLMGAFCGAEGFAILHDALLDAGCTDPFILNHCLTDCRLGNECSLLEALTQAEHPRRMQLPMCFTAIPRQSFP